MTYDFTKNVYHQGSCVHRQGVPIFSIVATPKGETPKLVCSGHPACCGGPLHDIKPIHPRRPA